MKNGEVLLTVMTERISSYGNVYFEGPREGGGKIIMRKTKNPRGEKVWKLFFTK